MLVGVNKLQNYVVQATDGEIGSIQDTLLDDEFWILRYIVVDTGRWLPGRRVLLTTDVLRRPDWRLHHQPVSLTREQVQNSPLLASHQPVSRQHELELHNHYGWPYYWGMGGVTPVGMEPFLPPALPPDMAPPETRGNTNLADAHLQSMRDLQGYNIHASDGELGHVDDFIVDDKTWEIRYMVVATSNWLPGRKVLISPQWLVGNVSWEKHEVTVVLTRENIKNSPPFESLAIPTRVYEGDLHKHYGQEEYWKRGKDTNGKTRKSLPPNSKI